MISVLKTRGTPDGHVRARQRASEADNLAWRPLPPQYVRQHICKCTNSFFAYDRSNHAQTTAMAVELDKMQTAL